MSDEPPRSAADPRDGEPYYIDGECPDCGTDLVLYDEYLDVFDSQSESQTSADSPWESKETDGDWWHDEWYCPDCTDGIHMDWPDEKHEEIEERLDGESVSLDEIDEVLEENSTAEEL